MSKEFVKTLVSPRLKGILITFGFHRQGMFVVLIFMLIGASLLNPNFMTLTNIRNILRQSAIIGVLAAGQTFVLLIGGIDLSVGNLVSLTGSLAAGFAKINVALGILVGLLSGGAVGLVNGVVVSKGKIQPFIVTLGTMSIAQGFALLYTGGFPIFDLPSTFSNIGSNYFLGIPVLVIIMAVVYIIFRFVLRQTKFGHYIYALGGNEEATRLSGINVDFIKTMAYIISGAAAGLAGVMLAARIAIGMPTMGSGYELQAIAAVVIGGTSLSGGRGSIFGTLIGTLIMGVINNMLNLMNVTAFWQYIVIGTIIVLAALINEFSKKYQGI